MKRRSVSAAIIIALVVAGTLWWKADRPQHSTSGSTVAETTPERNTPATRGAPNAVGGADDPRELAPRDDPVKVRRLIEAANVAINFWGKVVDQDRVPLKGVKISYTYAVHHGNDLGVAWIELEERKGEGISDGDGLFAITGIVGRDLVLKSLTKSGYVHRRRQNLTYRFGGNTAAGKFEAHPDKPVHFAMIHMGATEPLVHSEGEFNVSGDGAPTHWNLWSGEADPRGELAVTFRATPAVEANSTQRIDWRADLGIIGGGIIEAPWEEDVYRAPESGYSTTVVYPKQDQKEGVPYRSFYLRTVEGKYGRIQVELSPSHDGRTARGLITSDMNPRPGSRNLEPTEEE